MTANHGVGIGSMIVTHPMANLTHNNDMDSSSMTVNKYLDNGAANDSKMSLIN